MVNEKEFKACKKALIAGRTECFEGRQFLTAKNNEQFIAKDVASLYPTVMFKLDCRYGIGQIQWNRPYEQVIKENLIGMYYVKFNQDHLRYKIIPIKNENGQLDWKPKGTVERWLSTIDIQML